MPKPFGYSCLLDAYKCQPRSCDDLELHYRFLESLVDDLGMTKMTTPFVVHGPRDNGIERFPEKAGVSGWIGLIESGIQIHSLEPKRFMTLDVYSCKMFDPVLVERKVKDFFRPLKTEWHFYPRGVDYETI